MARIAEILKNILFLMVIIQFLPSLIVTGKRYYSDLFEPKTRIGIVSLEGMLIDTNKSAKQIKKFFKDPNIKAIVLKIDSPGGAPAACQELFYEINDLKKQYLKPVIAYGENFCASGAYYIASAADHIITQPATIVGSVGVYIGFPNFHDFLQHHKIKYTMVETGSYKSSGLLFRDLTPQQRTMFQSITDDTYAQFIQDVLSKRPQLSKIEKKEWADGKAFTGRQALALGMIDEIGSQSTLVRAIKSKAPIEGEISWVHAEKPGLFSRLFQSDQDSEYDGQTTSILRTSFAQTLMNWLTQPIYG